MNSIQKTGGSKSFFKRPETKGGMILAGILGVLGVVFLPTVLTYAATIMSLLRQIMEDGVKASFFAAILFALSAFFWHPKLKLLASYAVASFLRGVAAAFITIDPIGIMKKYSADRKKDQQKLKEQIGIVEGVKKGLEDDIAANNDEAKEATALARQAQKRGVKRVFTVASRQTDRLEEANVDYEKVLTMVKLHLAQLEKWDEICTVTIEDLDNAIRVQERKLKTITAAFKAMNAAKRILKHNEATELLEQTMEHLKNNFEEKFGAIEQFRKESVSIFETFDLQTGTMEENMLARLEDADRRADELLLANPNIRARVLVADNGDIQDAEFEAVVTERSGAATSEMSDLFKTK